MADAGHPWCAALLDRTMRPLYPARRIVIPEARGAVLEVGVGTGLNFGLYRDLEILVAVDPDPHMLRRAQPRAAGLPFPVELHQVGAEGLPFAANRFDTVVVTFTLCTIPDLGRALAEMHRVLKPGGRMLFAEHTRSTQALMARVQDALTPAWRRLSGGCHLNRPVGRLIREGGFALADTVPVWGERWTLFPVYRGVAVKGSGSGALE
jgi:SAM-dependent methyltransferase